MFRHHLSLEVRVDELEAARERRLFWDEVVRKLVDRCQFGLGLAALRRGEPDVVNAHLDRRCRAARQHAADPQVREAELTHMQMPQHFAILTTLAGLYKVIVAHSDPGCGESESGACFADTPLER